MVKYIAKGWESWVSCVIDVLDGCCKLYEYEAKISCYIVGRLCSKMNESDFKNRIGNMRTPLCKSGSFSFPSFWYETYM